VISLNIGTQPISKKEETRESTNLNLINLSKEKVRLTGFVRLPRPLSYQVRDFNGDWAEVEGGVEIEGGCLRYTKDGFGMTATAGHWRVEMNQDMVDMLNAQKQVIKGEAKKRANAQVWWGVVFALIFLGVFLKVLVSIFK
jgi:hypothetical protein